MGVPTSEVGYTSAIPRMEDHEVPKGHVVAFGEGEVLIQKLYIIITLNWYVSYGSRNKQKILHYTVLKDWFV